MCFDRLYAMDRDASRTFCAETSISLVERAIALIDCEMAVTPSAATRMFDDISAVTALCSSTAVAMAVAISLMVEMVEEISPMAFTAPSVDDCTDAI